MGRIIFTGGSGKAGRHCIPYLLAQGHEVLNLDLVPLDHPGVYTLKADLTKAGDVFNALSSHFAMAEYERPRHSAAQPLPPADAVIHFAAYARNLLVPDGECFAANATQTYNVVEAACKLGIRKVVLASSETVYGVCFAQGDADYHSFPLEEGYDCDPMDSYACSKLCGERVGRTFARRFNADVYVLRIGNVVEPHEYERDFPRYLADPPSRKRNAWSYVDARDLGQMCHLAVEKHGLGFQVFNATNDTITLHDKTEDYLRKECPGVKITREMGEHEAPLTNKKIKEVLGFKENHNWRQYVK